MNDDERMAALQATDLANQAMAQLALTLIASLGPEQAQRVRVGMEHAIVAMDVQAAQQPDRTRSFEVAGKLLTIMLDTIERVPAMKATKPAPER